MGEPVRDKDHFRIVYNELRGAMPAAQAKGMLLDAIRAAAAAGKLRCIEVVQGPLAELLQDQLGPQTGINVLQTIEERLAQAGSSIPAPRPSYFRWSSSPAPLGSQVPLETAPPESPLTGGPSPSDEHTSSEDLEENTSMIPLTTRPVPVVFVGASPRLADETFRSLGKNRMRPIRVSSREQLGGTHPHYPSVVVIDATDPPACTATEIVKPTEAIPSLPLVVVYGSDTAFGRSVTNALQNTSCRAVILKTQDGTGPLCDVVRSRQASTVPEDRDR
ncbi:MAG: hypothetical protein AAF355_05915 [Myxococcota bacterium]